MFAILIIGEGNGNQRGQKDTEKTHRREWHSEKADRWDTYRWSILSTMKKVRIMGRGLIHFSPVLRFI